MKKLIIFIFLFVIFNIIMVACNQTKDVTDYASDKKLSVVTTVFAPYDFVREIVGDKADITMLLPPASESHSFEPTPKDIITIQNCDVFIYVGGESDTWVADILESMDTSKMKIVTLMDCVSVEEERIVEGMEEEHDHEEEEKIKYDEHVWTSPKNAKLIVTKISDTLCEINTENVNTYRNNTLSYITKLEELDAAFQNVVDHAKRKTIVFGDRFPFRYLADAYELDYFAAFPGCSTESGASAATVKFLIDKINIEKIPVIFHIELGNENMAKTISESTGAKVLLLHSCHNVSKDNFISGISYIDLMKQNVEALKEAIW